VLSTPDTLFPIKTPQLSARADTLLLAKGVRQYPGNVGKVAGVSLEKIMQKEKLLLAALVFTALGCGVKAVETKVTVDDNGDLQQATLPDGTVAINQEEYETAMSVQVPPIEEMSAMALTVQPATANTGPTAGVNIGKFRIQISPDASYLDGCVRHSFLHLKVGVTNSNIDMGAFVELHLVAWFESGTPCLAVMNTGFIAYGWCQKICMKDVKKSVAGAVAGGLVAAGVSSTVAKIVSLLTAPIAAAALAM
jgi:hypothetical protein